MIEELNLGEIEEIELLLNASIEVAESKDFPKGRYQRAIYYILKKRTDPNYKFEDTAKVKPSELAAMFQADSPKDN